jgi:hypothetical protein
VERIGSGLGFGMRRSTMTINDLINAIEGAFPVGESTVVSRAVTGEPYVSFGLRGSNVSDDDLCRSMLAVFKEHVSDRHGTGNPFSIYWREKPEIDRLTEDMAMIYMRFLVSDKPRLDDEELDRLHIVDKNRSWTVNDFGNKNLSNKIRAEENEIWG